MSLPVKPMQLPSTLDMDTNVPTVMPTHIFVTCDTLITSIVIIYTRTTPYHNVQLSVRQQGEHNEFQTQVAKRAQLLVNIMYGKNNCD